MSTCATLTIRPADCPAGARLPPPAARRRRRATALSAATLLALLGAGCDRKGAPQTQPAEQAGSEATDRDYVAALNTASAFCRAWQQSDLAAGRALLSRRVRVTFTDARIRDAIVATPNPRHAAFEVQGGSPSGPRRITFRVRLFYIYAGEARQRIEAPVEDVVVQQDQAGQWLIDRFPMLDRPEPT